MSNKKNENELENTNTLAESLPKKVKIKIPLTKTEKDDVYVALNGKSYQIKRGHYVEVPIGVAKILEHKEKMLQMAIEYEAGFLNQSAE